MQDQIDQDKGKRLWEVIATHFQGIESQTIIFDGVAYDPLKYAMRQAQGIHTDLLLMKKNGIPVWEESILHASLVGRVLEVLAGEETPKRYEGEKWRGE